MQCEPLRRYSPIVKYSYLVWGRAGGRRASLLLPLPPLTLLYMLLYICTVHELCSRTVGEYHHWEGMDGVHHRPGSWRRVNPQSAQSAGPVCFLIFCSISISLLASLMAGRIPSVMLVQISWECTPPYLSTGISNLLQPAQAKVYCASVGLCGLLF
jgi:hypothetical protein